MIWTSNEAALATKGEIHSEWEGGKLVFDSRLIEPGDIFIALPGQTNDGHQFVNEALKKGAAAAIVSKLPEELKNKNNKILLVKDTLEALKNMALYKRSKSKATFVAVTGSVGKTSIKEQLGLAFSAHGKTFFSRANYNNFLGVPLNLASLPDDADFAIFEMGMDHAGEIEPLSQIVKPNIAIISMIENIHRANFDSIEGIAKAKAEIFSGLNKESTVLINSLSNCYEFLLELADKNKNIAKVISFGIDSNIIDYQVKNNQTRTQLNIFGQQVDIILDYILPQHQIANMAIVLSIIKTLNLNIEASVKKLQKFELPRGRGKVSKIMFDNKEITIIDDSYNAGPVSVKAALKNMTNYEGRKIAILGDMVDLGPESLEMHINLKEDIMKHNIDKVICFGKQMTNLYDCLEENRKLGSFLDLQSLAKFLPTILENGDIVLIKGSLYINNLYGFTKYFLEGKLDKI